MSAEFYCRHPVKTLLCERMERLLQVQGTLTKHQVLVDALTGIIEMYVHKARPIVLDH